MLIFPSVLLGLCLVREAELLWSKIESNANIASRSRFSEEVLELGSALRCKLRAKFASVPADSFFR